MTDQIRRSSRSIPANIAEAWAKKRYIKSFVSKLTDSLGEEYETEVWLDFSKDSNYISEVDYTRLIKEYDEVRKILISMITKPEKFYRSKPTTHNPQLTTHYSQLTTQLII